MSTIEHRVGQATWQIWRIIACDMEHDMACERPKQPFQDRLELQAVQLAEEAESLPQGRRREALLRKAREMNTASQIIDSWISSPGLRAPR
jgi:hypothetical protein